MQRTEQQLSEGKESGVERVKWVKGINSTVTDGNHIFGCEHNVWYIEVEK